jgi:hypothetical protein
LTPGARPAIPARFPQALIALEVMTGDAGAPLQSLSPAEEAGPHRK